MQQSCSFDFARLNRDILSVIAPFSGTGSLMNLTGCSRSLRSTISLVTDIHPKPRLSSYGIRCYVSDEKFRRSFTALIGDPANLDVVVEDVDAIRADQLVHLNDFRSVKLHADLVKRHHFPLESLRVLTNLVEVSIRLSGKVDLTNFPFAGSKATLRKVHIQGCSVRIDVFNGLCNLAFLILEGCRVYGNRLSLGSSLVGLHIVHCDFIPNFSYLSMFDRHENVASLYLDACCLTSVAGIEEKFPTVEHLSLAYNDLRNINAVASLSNLKKLNLDETCVNSMEPLAHIRSLESLSLVDVNQVIDLTPLESLQNLTTFHGDFDAFWTSPPRRLPLILNCADRDPAWELYD